MPHRIRDELFRQALLIRRVEEKIIERYWDDVIQSPVHLSIGQEAVAVGLCSLLKPEDRVFGTYRSHAVFLAKGGDLKRLFAELFGKEPGHCKGKAGSMHLAAPEVGAMGASAIVASAIPHAVGDALAARLSKDGRLSVAFFGDGAAEEGVFHESLNFAALKKLPVLFVCENNGLAVHAKTNERQSFDLAGLAKAYGIPFFRVDDGTDPWRVQEALSPVIEAARSGKGPQFVEIRTCRYKEHVGPGEDLNAGYRAGAEVEVWKARDPLLTDKDRIDRFEAGIAAEIDAAVRFAENAPWPGPEHLLSDVGEPDPADRFSAADIYEGRLPHGGVLSYREALALAHEACFAANPRAVLIGQGVTDHKGIFGTTLGLAERFGSERVVETPLAEEGMAGVSLGASLGGLYPIQTHIRADFILLAANQIVNLIAKYRYMFGGLFKAPMLIRAVIGRSWGQGAQHSQSLQSLFAHIPGLAVIMPSDAQSVLESYAYAACRYDGPVISFEHRLLYEIGFEIDRERLATPLAPFAPRRIAQGDDVTVVSTSIMTLEAKRAAAYLKRTAGIGLDVIDLNCVSHIDRQPILDSLRKTGRLIVADTSWPGYGVAAEVCRLVAESDPGLLKAPVVSLGMAQAPCPTAKSLEDVYYPNLADLVDAAARLAAGKAEHGVVLPDERSMADVYKKFKGPF